MSASYVPSFMCDNADDFVGRFGLHDCACIDENTAAIDESVETLRIDENNADTASA
ncbi:hypothetical protein D3C71_2231420 [compost metagenome]